MVQVYQGAIYNNNTGNMKLFVHTLDSERKPVTIRQTYGNIGGSFVTGDGISSGSRGVKATSVLLSDIYDKIVHDKYNGTRRLNIVMKIDIEQ